MYAKSSAIISLIAGAGFASMASAQSLTVTLSGLKSDEGQLVVSFYNDKKHWLSEKPEEIVLQEIIPLKDKVTDSVIEFTLELPEGEYAMYLFQDKDSNGELKSNWIGIPKEPVATSNNAKGKMGPPKYQDALFLIADAPVEQNLNLANMD